MAIKNLTSQAGKNGAQKSFKNGGQGDTITATDDEKSGFGYIINGGGGDDFIFGSDFDSLVPDPENPGEFITGGDLLIGGSGGDTIAGGGGDDTIYGGTTRGTDRGNGTNTLIGDGGFEFDLSTGTAVLIDSITVAAGNDVTASNDTIYGGDDARNEVFGDYNTVTLSSGTVDDITSFTGGIDTITGGDEGNNSLYGDVLRVFFNANSSFKGGDDIITGGTAFGGGGTPNTLYGDAQHVNFSGGGNESFVGGDDTLTAGDGVAGAPGGIGVNVLYGDVVQISGNGSFQGGDDRLVAGIGTNDDLYGDWKVDGSDTAVGGDDTFVFFAGTGVDTIWDFEVAEFVESTGGPVLTDAHDVVELNGFAGVNSFADIETSFADAGGDLALTLGSDEIIFKGLAGTTLTAEDFAFNVV